MKVSAIVKVWPIKKVLLTKILPKMRLSLIMKILPKVRLSSMSSLRMKIRPKTLSRTWVQSRVVIGRQIRHCIEWLDHEFEVEIGIGAS